MENITFVSGSTVFFVCFNYLKTVIMETTRNKKQEKERKRKEFDEYLKKKKAKDGKLSKLGEWLLSGRQTGLYIKDRDMKYILR